MKKVIFTEEQMKYILREEEVADYLNALDIDSEVPENAYGTEIMVNNTDSDAEDNVTTTDNISQKRACSNRLFRKSSCMPQVYENKELDNKKVNGFGLKSDNYINQISQNGGKMAKNINNRINKNGDGQSLNTTEVEISRMKKDKKDNPANFAKNGGDETLRILKSTKNKQRNIGRAEREANDRIANTYLNNSNIAIQGQNKKTKSNNPKVYYY